MIRQHADGLQLLAGHQVRFVDGQDDVAVALVGLGGQGGLDLRGEGGVVEVGAWPSPLATAPWMPITPTCGLGR
jgi:hypothetical protein